MIKSLLILIASLSLVSFSSSIKADYPISQVRKLYGAGVADAGAAKELMKIVSGSELPIYLAYKGGAEALMAKHANNPYAKLEYLSRSMQTLTKAIAADPDNPEIRFIRFSVQYYAPRFLGFSRNLDEDAAMMIKRFEDLAAITDRKTLQGITDLLVASGNCNATDAQKLSAIIQSNE
jgi:hypothetical protein